VLELRDPGARLAPSRAVPPGSVLLGPDGVVGSAVAGTVRSGEAAPGWLVEARHPVRYLRLPGSAPRTVIATVADGRIAAVTGDSLLRGEQVRALRVDGRELRAFHLLGTDQQGRDLWARTLHGGRISLLVGLVATLVALVIGVLYGAIAGWRGGRTDAAMLSAINVLDALPFLFLVILLMTLVGGNLLTLFAALGAVQWLTTARIVRAQVLSLAGGDMIAAARSLGLPAHRILLYHLVPSCLGPVIVFAALTVPAVILEESFLSFIGLQVQHRGLPLDSWGALVAQGMAALGSGGAQSWLLLVPATMMTATLLALNLVGDGLRAALDPRLARMAR
jgi:oligopeptide transport system permease protein